MTDADAAKITAKKEAKQLSNVDKKCWWKKRVGKTRHYRDWYNPQCVFDILENLTEGNYVGTDEGGVLLKEERMTDADADKVDVNAKSDAPDASDASNGSKIDNPKINVKRGIGKRYAVPITLFWRVYLRHQALHDSQSNGEVVYTGKFDATIDAEKEAKEEAKKEGTKAYAE